MKKESLLDAIMELSKNVSYVLGEKSSVDIQLHDTENNKYFTKRLSVDELGKIKELMTIDWL